ncbi:MAG: UDP-2,3-diacylglucosamine diphosphatase [Saprospiraceae bacterium]|nr:UDP-2,3-diacylglucosamine diphosphatase [Saprospiraceae bacterium]
MPKRKVEVVVISDIHLGTYGCHADCLLRYLKSVEPEILVLNGDIVDLWNFKKSYFPKSHLQVIRQILKMTENGTKTYYITGNHDDALRRFSSVCIGNLILDDKLVLNLDGKKTWIFHGDIFDATTRGWARILAKLGGKGYDILILMNRFTNHVLERFGREKVSFSKRIKNGVKRAVKWINDFEQTAAALAIDQNYHVVICGHIHQPQIKILSHERESILYLNSGDWVENCSALEYNQGEWRLHFEPVKTPRTAVHSEWEEDWEKEAETEVFDFIFKNGVEDKMMPQTKTAI